MATVESNAPRSIFSLYFQAWVSHPTSELEQARYKNWCGRRGLELKGGNKGVFGDVTSVRNRAG